jgi:hypothetical protein
LSNVPTLAVSLSLANAHASLPVAYRLYLPQAWVAAILPRHTDRMRPFLGKAGIVDDPGFDRSIPLNGGEDHLPHLFQDVLVRPALLSNKMQ